MSDLASGMSGEGEILKTFALSGRGQALVVKEDFLGTISRNGIVESDAGRAAYIGPDYVYGGEKGSWVAVVVEAAKKDLFSQGQRVRFYRKP